MSERKCKRCGAKENRIHGFCSMECRTAWEYEDDIRDLTARIDSLTAENKVLEDACEILRKQNKRLFSQVFSDGKPELNVCKACGGDGTVLLTDGYEGQVIATAECIYCNGTGRVSKEREE